MDEHEFEGFRCICGELVAVMHKDCRSMAYIDKDGNMRPKP